MVLRRPGKEEWVRHTLTRADAPATHRIRPACTLGTGTHGSGHTCNTWGCQPKCNGTKQLIVSTMRTLIKPMENELFTDCGDLTINGVQRGDSVSRSRKTYKPMQILTLQECPEACMAPADVTRESHPIGDRNYPSECFSCIPNSRN